MFSIAAIATKLTKVERIVHQSTAGFAVKGGISTGYKRFRLPVETDAQKLVNFVCGSNINKTGEDIKIKDDSEYPDWIWDLNLGPPPPLDAYDPNTKEYWEQLHLRSMIRQKRFMAVQSKPTMRLGVNQRKEMEWLEKVKYRAVTAQEYDAGWSPELCDEELDKRLYLRPQESDEPLYMDEYQLPPKF
ncbi:39S ribosomal protein L54-like protein [Dinothrombium tinctorium]|uniref:Large ribosomal subunit protein mL54 n=1 Tax=Dinothrombium tinctorium TaxID=1965070 RepID=A0A443QXP5_9ACAR|nr:39S ribosomal protein L54-like protein [Dinothrombium tinctorium]